MPAGYTRANGPNDRIHFAEKPALTWTELHFRRLEQAQDNCIGNKRRRRGAKLVIYKVPSAIGATHALHVLAYNGATLANGKQGAIGAFILSMIVTIVSGGFGSTFNKFRKADCHTVITVWLTRSTLEDIRTLPFAADFVSVAALFERLCVTAVSRQGTAFSC